VAERPAERAAARQRVRLLKPEDLPAIRRFNERLVQGGQRYQLPFDPRLPGEATHRPPGYPVYREMLVVEDGEEIRAGMLEYHSVMVIHGEERPFCWAHLPVSEGLVDSRYAMTVFLMVRTALAEQAFQMCLGVGSREETWARLLEKLGWKHAVVPFLFYPARPANVLRGLTYLQRSPRLRTVSRALASTGLAGLIEGGLAARRRLTGAVPAYEAQEEASFGPWADRLFEEANPLYGAAARRDATTLNILYPPEDTRFTRLRVRSRGAREDLGWVVVIHRQMQENPYFGNLRVGTLVDGFGRPENVPALVEAGRRHLARAGVDLIVANWSHEAWVSASRRVGFLSGPSNFLFYTSPAGSPLLEASCPLAQIHLSRGDCDGPGQLLPPASQGQS
jgi:hypothetical protein